MNAEHEYTVDGAIFHGSIDNVMGTKFDLIIIGRQEKEVSEIWSGLCSEIGRMDRMLNRFDKDSEVFRANSESGSGPVRISEELSGIVRLCLEYRKKTGGLFDITKGGNCRLELSADGIMDLGGAEMDFGGFAKGYFLKECEKVLRKNGIGTAFACFGNSSILALGRHPYGDCWKVGIVNPYSHATVAEADLVDSALSTSGNMPGYCGHIINPLTLRSCNDRKIVTVKHADALDAEVLSTVMMIADEREKEYIKGNFPEMEYNEYIL